MVGHRGGEVALPTRGTLGGNEALSLPVGPLGLADLPVDAPVVHDAEHGGQDQENEDSENGQHSDQSFDVCRIHGHHCRADSSLQTVAGLS